MSNLSPAHKKLSATLVLEDDVRLGGVLSSLLDGRLQLESVEPLEDTSEGELIAVTTGSSATLSLDDDYNDPSLENVRVTISALSGDSVSFTVQSGDQKTVHRLREIIAGGFGGNAPPVPQQNNKAAADNSGDSNAAESKTPDLALAPNPEHTALLGRVETQAMKELERAMDPFLADLTNYLMDLSSRLRQNVGGNNLHYQAASGLRRQSHDISQRMLKQIRSYFKDLTPKVDDDQLWHYNIGSVDELDIIGTQEFEDYLAIDRIVTLGENQHRLALEALIIRFATLVDADPNTLRLPIHVRQVARAFQRALSTVDIAPNVQAHIFDYFSKRLIQQFDGFYEPLNELLAEADIRPRVEAEIRLKGTLLNVREEDSLPAARLRAIKGETPPEISPTPEHSGYLGDNSAAAQENGQKPQARTEAEVEVEVEVEKIAQPSLQAAPLTSESAQLSKAQSGASEQAPATETQRYHQQLGEQLAGAISHANPKDMYRSVVDALNFKREVEGMAGSASMTGPIGSTGTPVSMSGTWDGATVPSTEMEGKQLADAQSIARVLSALQHNSQARADVQEIDSLRKYLASHREDIDDLQDTSGLTAESLNQLDMVDNLFGTIRSQLDVSAKLKPTLGNLQIPLAKLALLDPEFFVEEGHTARAVVDKLSELATSANFPNRALEGRINDIIDAIVAEYETDSAIFDDALEKLERLSAQQERTLSRNVERVVRTMEGQEKLADARRDVSTLLNSRLQPPSAPKLLLNLIDAGWRDLLVLTHLREGVESQAWMEQVNSLDILCAWLAEQRYTNEDSELLKKRRDRAEPLLDMIRQEITGAFPTQISHDEVLDQLMQALSGHLSVENAPVSSELPDTEPQAKKLRARVEDLPRLRRWVKRVEQLPGGSWLAYRDKKNQKKRMQLAWISPAKDRYIFVNERGQKVADLSAIRLARQLSRGVRPPAPADRLSVVDKSMYETLEHVQKTLSFARNHDSLTKLINRDTFLNQMGRALRHSQQKGSQHALLYLNIDQFALVNDLYDRVTGDQVLLEFARLLAQLHGKKSSSARLDGDEFAVLLLDKPIELALQVGEKIRSDIEATSMDIDGEDVTFTVSIGMAAILEHSPVVEDIMRGGASAMRRAKQKGRNRVEAYTPSNEGRQAIDYKELKHQSREDLEEALATDRFVLQAQPIVKTAVGDDADTTQHYELLLGLRNEEGGLSSPTDFIESAERYGFMTLVDRWVVHEAFSWISMLMDEQRVIPHIAINLSGSSVTDDSFMDYLLEEISEFGVGTSRLCFEITETGTISNLVKAADFVRAFRNIGCKFSIDDFGTGLASHNYLRELPVDYVKIDGSFITGIETNRQDYAMARSINDLAHFLGQKTIAESVENEGIIKMLEEIGVDYLQGWGVGKPKPLTEVTHDISKLEQ